MGKLAPAGSGCHTACDGVDSQRGGRRSPSGRVAYNGPRSGCGQIAIVWACTVPPPRGRGARGFVQKRAEGSRAPSLVGYWGVPCYASDSLQVPPCLGRVAFRQPGRARRSTSSSWWRRSPDSPRPAGRAAPAPPSAGRRRPAPARFVTATVDLDSSCTGTTRRSRAELTRRSGPRIVLAMADHVLRPESAPPRPGSEAATADSETPRPVPLASERGEQPWAPAVVAVLIVAAFVLGWRAGRGWGRMLGW